ncbi:MAG: filamentous hemagglutinin N-terminal domain-containing protein, partial [Gammaproteobacteria bacterium]
MGLYTQPNNLKNKKKVSSSLWIALAISALAPTATWALPQDGQVAAGSAAISSPTSNSLHINQTTDKAVINWQSYNVAQQESVHYQQPSSSSISLNRVNPNNGASAIFGSITSNGRVWLINPAGIWFGPGSYVNVAGLVA